MDDRRPYEPCTPYHTCRVRSVRTVPLPAGGRLTIGVLVAGLHLARTTPTTTISLARSLVTDLTMHSTFCIIVPTQPRRHRHHFKLREEEEICIATRNARCDPRPLLSRRRRFQKPTPIYCAGVVLFLSDKINSHHQRRNKSNSSLRNRARADCP